jgi:uncharacterized membrane protein
LACARGQLRLLAACGPATMMGKNRLEMFSDGVIAIIVTIMVIGLMVPHSGDWGDLASRWPTWVTCALSLAVVAIYGFNHHQLMQMVQRVDRVLLGFNLLWLFCLSLIPLGAEYLGANPGRALPVAVYGALMLACDLSFNLLHRRVVAALPAAQRLNPLHRRFLVRNWISTSLIGASMPLAFIQTRTAICNFVGIALAYFIPDDRGIEQLHFRRDDGKA